MLHHTGASVRALLFLEGSRSGISRGRGRHRVCCIAGMVLYVVCLSMQVVPTADGA